MNRMERPTAGLTELRALAEKATPGPWAWFGNTRVRHVFLGTTHSGRLFVMGFKRWGMNSAQPMFRNAPGDEGWLEDACPRYEVLGGRTVAEAGKEPYRHDIVGFDSADAAFIAAANPATVLALLDEIEALRAAERRPICGEEVSRVD